MAWWRGAADWALPWPLQPHVVQVMLWDGYLSKADSIRSKTRARLDEVGLCAASRASRHAGTELRCVQVFNYAKIGCPRKHGDTWYVYHNTGLQNQYVLYQLDGVGECPARGLTPTAGRRSYLALCHIRPGRQQGKGVPGPERGVPARECRPASERVQPRWPLLCVRPVSEWQRLVHDQGP